RQFVVKLVLHNGPPLYPERVATGSGRFKWSPDASVKRKIWAATFMTPVNVNVIVGPAEGITGILDRCDVSSTTFGFPINRPAGQLELHAARAIRPTIRSHCDAPQSLSRLHIAPGAFY